MLNNYHGIGLIQLLFPAAKIIYTRRHPIANCLGCYQRIFSGANLPFVYDLQELADNYRNHHRLMQHWQQLLPDRIFTVNYEATIANQETLTRELLAFCGLEWEDNCLNFHENTRAVKTASNMQIRQGLYTDAVERWKNYREFLGPLLPLEELVTK